MGASRRRSDYFQFQRPGYATSIIYSAIIFLLFPTDINGLNKTALKEQTLEMFRHAYWSYMNHAYPADELMPLSCAGRFRGITPSRGDVDDALGNFALTLVDSLDTLVVVGEYDEFERAVQLIVNDVRFDQDIVVSVFETNIRMVGGLLSGHLMAKLLQNWHEARFPWYTDELLRMAVDMGYRLLPAFNTTTGVPYPRVNLKYGLNGRAQYLRDQHDTCTACAGTMILEFAALSRLTGIGVFEEKARRAMDFLWQQRHRGSDLMGTVLNVHNGDWVRRDSGVGAGIDSYYEYCLKAYILLGDEAYLHRFNKHYAAVMKYVSQGPLLVDVHMHKPTVVSKSFMDALLAFWPGLQVLKGDLKPAIETHELLYQVIQRHSFLPEAFTHDFQVHWGEHPLRPEFVESTYFLYKATKDPHYLEVGKQVVDSLNKHVRVKCGFAGVKDVRTMAHEDRMDSFFLAETFKYLYLLFAEREDLIFDPDDYIFTTEAHFLPLSISSYANYYGEKPGSSPTSPFYDPAEDVDRTNARSCPNAKRDFEGELTSYANLIRSRLKDFVSRQSAGTCGKMRMKATEFDPSNPEHIYHLKKMGITLVTQADGKMQLVHSTNSAVSGKDAEEGMAFMQEMIQAAQQSDQSQMFYHPPRIVQIVSQPMFGRFAVLASPAQFGRDLTGDFRGVTGRLVHAEPYKACTPLTNAPRLVGRIVVMERGDCMFVEKCRRAQKAGAIGAIIVDNKSESEYAKSPVFAMSGDGSTDVRIPAVFVFGRDGNRLRQRSRRSPSMIVRLGEKMINPSTIFQHYLRDPTDRRYFSIDAINHDTSAHSSSSSSTQKSVRLGDTVCYELDDQTIRCEKSSSSDSPTSTEIDRELDALMDSFPGVGEKSRVAPPPKSSSATGGGGSGPDIQTTIELEFDSGNEEEDDQSTTSGGSGTIELFDMDSLADTFRRLQEFYPDALDRAVRALNPPGPTEKAADRSPTDPTAESPPNQPPVESTDQSSGDQPIDLSQFLAADLVSSLTPEIRLALLEQFRRAILEDETFQNMVLNEPRYAGLIEKLWTLVTHGSLDDADQLGADERILFAKLIQNLIDKLLKNEARAIGNGQQGELVGP